MVLLTRVRHWRIRYLNLRPGRSSRVAAAAGVACLAGLAADALIGWSGFAPTLLAAVASGLLVGALSWLLARRNRARRNPLRDLMQLDQGTSATRTSVLAE
jgi:Flp pilus assembly protein TadB